MMSEMSSIIYVKNSLAKASDPGFAERSAQFFKTGPGDYAEGERFLGIRVPELRKIAKEFCSLTIEEVRYFLQGDYNEERLFALFVLIEQYKKGDSVARGGIYQFYMDHRAYVNNWNLVDSSAYQIVGAHLFGKDKAVLHDLARAESLWDRRIAMVATFYDIKRGVFVTAFAIAEKLLEDSHDLIHKAVGWMLREIGKRDEEAERLFLDRHAGKMPRTMLRYAIERFPVELRRHYLERSAASPFSPLQ
jgi:3-methyladenine DNA glycosylase AlkD